MVRVSVRALTLLPLYPGPGHRGQSGNIGRFATYIVGRIAGDLDIIHSQGPVVVDRSTRLAAVHGGSFIWPSQVHQQPHRSSTSIGVEGRGSGAVG